MKFHYTYEIINITNNKKYIGCRTSNVDPYDDLGVCYFSSSKDAEFIKKQKETPDNFIYDVIGIFDNRLKAIEHEIKLHEYYNVGVNKQFYNKVKQTSKKFDTSGVKIVRDNNWKQNLSISAKNREKISCKYCGMESTKQLIERYHNENCYHNPGINKEDVSDKRKTGKHKIKRNNIVTCPHCNKTGDASGIYRWHFNNCKRKK